MHRQLHRVAIVLVAAVALALSGACSDGAGFDSGGAAGNEVRLVQQPWEDLVVENEIVSQILTDLGYETRVQELSVPLGAQALVNGDADAYLGNWWPSQEPVFGKHLDSGKIEVLSTLVTGTTYAPAVPKQVADKYGVRSLADLKAKESLFGRQFLGIEPGTPGNQFIEDAIKDDAYGLGGWSLVESSTPAMLAEVDRRVAKDKPVVFLGWEPHWMNVEWDLVYLEDPDKVWPGAGEIRVVTRKDFKADNPNVARLLSQMKVDRETASEWIHQFSKEKKPAETIAREWIEQNQDQVEAWLEGVETADGKAAGDAP
jgi:glycine betaine/proline transport system substrate-binding protein